MPTTPRTALTDQLAAEAQTFDDIFHALDRGTHHDGQDPYDLLAEMPLEITVRRRLVVVLATGGPHIELVGDLDGDGDVTNVHLAGYWSSTRVILPLAAYSASHRAMQHYAELMSP